MKYRLVKRTHVGGFVDWIIERKIWWWWDYCDCAIHERTAKDKLAAYRAGEKLINEIIE